MAPFCPLVSIYDVKCTFKQEKRIYFHHAGVTLSGDFWNGVAGSNWSEDGCRVGVDVSFVGNLWNYPSLVHPIFIFFEK